MRTVLIPLTLAVLGPAPGQIELPKPLSGTYTVDPKGQGDRVFKDLTTATRYLSLAGVTGDFRLEVRPGEYAGGLLFFPIPGQKEGQRIPVVAVGEGKVVLSHDAGIVQLTAGVRGLLFDGLEFAGSGGEPVFSAANGCDDIEIRNCRFTRQAGGQRLIEIQGRPSSRRWHIHHNRFELGNRVRYGIYTQSTYELDIHHNDFDCDGNDEPISIWNANRSDSRVHHNLFHGQVSQCCMRLDVSGHDVDVRDNVFLLRMTGRDSAVIRSQGLRNTAYNKIRHNVFVVLGEGMALYTGGPLALNHNLYAVQAGAIGKVKNTVLQELKDWQEGVREVALDEQADQDSAACGPRFFERHARLLGLLHRFPDGGTGEAAGDGDGGPGPGAAMDAKAEVRFLIEVLQGDDPVAIRLAIQRLLVHGPRAAPAVPALGRLCSHRHAAVRAGAASALGAIRIGAEIVIPELARLLDDPDELVLLAAIRTLGGFAHLAADSAARLRALEQHASKAVQSAAAEARRAALGEGRR